MRWMVGRTRTEQEQGGGRGGGVSCIPLYFFRHPPQFLFPDDLPSSSVLPQYDAPEKYIDIYICVLLCTDMFIMQFIFANVFYNKDFIKDKEV